MPIEKHFDIPFIAALALRDRDSVSHLAGDSLESAIKNVLSRAGTTRLDSFI